MEFNVDESKKEEIIKIASNRKSVKVMRVIENVSLALGVLSIITYVLLSVIPGIFMETGPEGIVRKSSIRLFAIFIPLIVLTLLTALFVHVLRKVFTASIFGNRVNEVLQIQGDKLIYSYRVMHNQSPMGQGLITMDIDSIDFVTYTEKSKQIVIDGLMSSQSIDLTSTKEEVDLVEPESYAFGLYDYFQPSLVEELESRGVHINYE